jgi:hypothetical protein
MRKCHGGGGGSGQIFNIKSKAKLLWKTDVKTTFKDAGTRRGQRRNTGNCRVSENQRNTQTSVEKNQRSLLVGTEQGL